jgi:DNA-binding NarL/FixJ family response regulator
VCTGAFADCAEINYKIEKSRPDVVLMDIEMSGINGIDGTKMIVEKYPSIRVLIQTVFEDDDKIFAAICAGASGFILKKSSPSRLIEAIQEVRNGGAPMSPEIANKVLKLFQKFAPQQKANTLEDIDNLSRKEKEVLHMMMEGSSLQTIADKCFVSLETIRSHVKNIYKKLHVHSYREALIKAYKSRRAW